MKSTSLFNFDQYVYLIDDNEDALETYGIYIERIPGFVVTGKSTDPKEAQTVITNKLVPVDIVILDIVMPSMSGFDLAAKLNDQVVIFSTGHRDRAAEAYDFGITDYIVKPPSFERFKIALERARERWLAMKGYGINPPKPKMFIPGNGKEAKRNINTYDILFIEGMGNYTKIVLIDKEIVTYLSLKQMEILLPKPWFYRVHRSYMVNIARIDNVDVNDITMEKGSTRESPALIPLGEAKNEFFEFLKRS